VVVCLERGADLHMAQLIPLPLTVSCFTKIQIGFTFLVPAHLGSPGNRAVKQVCVCVVNIIYIRAQWSAKAETEAYSFQLLSSAVAMNGLTTSTCHHTAYFSTYFSGAVGRGSWPQVQQVKRHKTATPKTSHHNTNEHKRECDTGCKMSHN